MAMYHRSYSFGPSKPSAQLMKSILRELPMPSWAFGLIALACFLALLGVLWTFRNTAARYDKPDHGPDH